MYSYPEHSIGDLNYTKLAFSMISYIPDSILSTLQSKGRMEGLKSAIYHAALESYREEYTVKETRALAMKYIRQELAANGIRRTSRASKEGKYRLLQTEFSENYVDDKDKLRKLDELRNEEMGKIMDYENMEFTLPTVLLDALLDISNSINQTMDKTAEEALVIGLEEINSELL